MKIAVVYNRDSRNVINLFGLPNREKIGMKTIKRLTDALKKGGHQVIAIEADKDLVDRLEEFMPRVVAGERPGMVFNVSYGLQGQARYTHVPSILEMVGIPYVASGPLGHSLALDKVVTKMILRQNHVPTPDFALLDRADAPVPPELPYPLVVKPKNEAVSFGLKVVHNEEELREGAQVIFDKFQQPVLAEQYIEGREINVGLLGNQPPEAFPAVELNFGSEGPAIYTYEDKTGKSGRTITHTCPAPIGEALTESAKEIAVKAFNALGLYDCARVDMRLDARGDLYVLEVNSLPSLGEHGSYLIGAADVGLDFEKFVNRLVEVASSRYFGTPQPPALDQKKVDTPTYAFGYITQRREQLEKRLRSWVELSSRTGDLIGVDQAVRRAGELFKELGMKPVEEFTDEPEVWTWQTAGGFEGGTLFVGHLDVPAHSDIPHQHYRRDPEWLYGDGVGVRAALAMLEYACRPLRSLRKLRKLPMGVLFYADEGRSALESAEMIRKAAGLAKRVLVLRPGAVGDAVVTQRRGVRRLRLRVQGEGLRPGRITKKPPLLNWTWDKLDRISRLGSKERRLSVSTMELRTERHTMMTPHRVNADLLVTYLDKAAADETEQKMREILGKGGPKWELNAYADRPPMKERANSKRLAKSLAQIAQRWEIPLKLESSTYPSVAGLVPAKTACICGIGPVTRDRGTPHEAVQRISLVQRTLLLAQYLAEKFEE